MTIFNRLKELIEEAEQIIERHGPIAEQSFDPAHVQAAENFVNEALDKVRPAAAAADAAVAAEMEAEPPK